MRLTLTHSHTHTHTHTCGMQTMHCFTKLTIRQPIFASLSLFFSLCVCVSVCVCLSVCLSVMLFSPHFDSQSVSQSAMLLLLSSVFITSFSQCRRQRLLLLLHAVYYPPCRPSVRPSVSRSAICAVRWWSVFLALTT